MENETLPQFDRDRHGSLYDRGFSDAHYYMDPWPHWWPEIEGRFEVAQAATLAEVNEYMAGYTRCTTRKEW
jgi:hypothetical protein